ncbi:phage tail assembly chaperone [Brevundimonas sp. NPDC092305]|uniref:phage tail assembly chaperone n=1 Tax=Brevundimonas sp. NPDC092305 TaxID=3363957 RepID=UPI0038120DC7
MVRVAVSLGVGPAEFWRLSLKEWRMLTAPSGEGEPLGRAALERMVREWPD